MSMSVRWDMSQIFLFGYLGTFHSWPNSWLLRVGSEDMCTQSIFVQWSLLFVWEVSSEAEGPVLISDSVEVHSWERGQGQHFV